MATPNHHVGVDDRRQRSVSDLIQHWDPDKKPEPQLTFTQKINQQIEAIPSWVKTTVFASLIILEFAALFHFLDGCSNWHGLIIRDSAPLFCQPVVHFIDWCAAQPYCKPLVQTIGWLG